MIFCGHFGHYITADLHHRPCFVTLPDKESDEMGEENVHLLTLCYFILPTNLINSFIHYK